MNQLSIFGLCLLVGFENFLTHIHKAKHFNLKMTKEFINESALLHFSINALF